MYVRDLTMPQGEVIDCDDRAGRGTIVRDNASGELALHRSQCMGLAIRKGMAFRSASPPRRRPAAQWRSTSDRPAIAPAERSAPSATGRQCNGTEPTQERPDELWVYPLKEAKRLVTRGGPEVGSSAARLTRIPAGHPEGFLEGFANLYAEAARAIRAARRGGSSHPDAVYPNVHDGVAGAAFVEAAVRSSAERARWVSLRS